MERFKKRWGQTGTQIALFFLCMMLFNWPFLTIIPLARQGLLYFYIFMVTLGILCLLFLLSRGVDHDEGGGDV